VRISLVPFVPLVFSHHTSQNAGIPFAGVVLKIGFLEVIIVLVAGKYVF
jgi:hypothetical protein